MEKQQQDGKRYPEFVDLLIPWKRRQGWDSWQELLAPSVITDKLDYRPGETAMITASGFQLGETITFSIADDPQDPGDDGDADLYQPFSVTDGGAGDLDGKANGQVVTTWFVPTDDDGSGSGTPDALNATLLLTAIGSDGLNASTTFTDSGSLIVTTDKQDYVPGDGVRMTASGFADGETVTFQIDELTPGDDNIYQKFDPIVVTDGQLGDADGEVNGQITTTWIVPDAPTSLNAELQITATSSDGLTGSTTFLDAQGSFSKPYAHWADVGPSTNPPGDWNNNILNDNKSNYFEGEVIPHVWMYGASNQTPLETGKSYSFNVTYNYYQQNTDAGGFAYMTQYNLSRQPNVFDWATPAITPTADGTYTNGGGMTDGNGNAIAGGADFYTVDADITNVSLVTYEGTGTKDGVVTITFTYTGTDTTNGYAAIYYGLYVAQPGEVPDQGAGTTNGANAWSGGSLQTTVDIGGSGATSLQLAPSAIIAGEISGLKFNDLNDNGSQDSGEPGLSGWTIFLDSDINRDKYLDSVLTADGIDDDLDGNGVTDPLGFYYFSVTPGTYYVYEENQDGWEQTAPSTIYYGPLVVNATTPTYLNKDFGNHLAETTVGLEGSKWHDLNADGSWLQPEEPGLAGWTIYLDIDNDNSFDAGEEPFGITGVGGGWAITAELEDGTYYLREELLEPEWIQSNPTSAVDGEYRIVVLNGKYTIFNDTTEVATGDIDFGNFRPATKSGYKYEDFDGSGTLTDGDIGIANWTITLTGIDGAGNVVDLETTTNGNGYYEFSNLTPGSYTVTEGTDPEYTASSPTSIDFELISGENEPDNNFFNFRPATKSGYKYEDFDGSGTLTDGDIGIANWTITLTGIDGAGNVVDLETTTNGNGYYEFSNLTPGSYTVTEGTDPEYTASSPTSIDFELISGENEPDNNFFNFRPATKSGYKYEDFDGSGTLTDGDIGIANWTITLTGIDGAGNVVDLETTTNGNGYYEFSNLTPGSYTVTEGTDPEYTASSPTSIDFELISGENEPDNNFFNFRPATKSGYKYEDFDGSGTLTDGDIGIANWTITLTGIDGAGNVVDLETTTNGNGYYEFSNLTPGSYTVTEGTDPEYTASSPTSIDFELISGENEPDNNFFNFRPATKSGYKYEDFDGSGTLTDGDIGIANWTITLTGIDGAGNVVDLETTTNGNGYYEFSNLTPGSYTVTEGTDPEYTASSPTSIDFELISGENEPDNNFFNFRPATKSGYKYEDFDGSGTLTDGDIGIANWTITLTGIDGAGNVVDLETTTNGNGYYEFSNLTPGSYTVTEGTDPEYTASSPTSIDFELISGENEPDNNFFNFRPATKSGYKYEDFDGSGTLTDGDIGIANWTITLTGIDGAGNVVDLETTTNGNGYYEFSNLTPGSYTVTEGTDPEYTASSPTSIDFELISGENEPDNNFFNFRPATKSGYKYEDFDGSGTLTDGDIGIANWTITLTGIDGAGNVVDLETTTNGNGYYEFSNLTPGSYTVTEGTDPEYTASSPTSIDFELISGENEPDNNFFNFRPATKSGYKYEDFDGSGTLTDGDIGIANWTITLTGIDGAGNVVDLETTTNGNGYYEFSNLTPGSYTVTEGTDPEYTASSPTSIDFELISGENEPDNNFFNFRPATKSGYKYEDFDGSGTLTDGDIGIANWTITLTGIDGAGNVVDLETTTNGNGYYEFSNLTPGSYTVTEGTDPEYTASSPTSIDFELISGENEPDNNFFNFRPASKSGYKYEDVDQSGTLTQGDIGIEGWTITLTGTDGAGNAVSKTTATDGTGFYEFLGLAPGEYTVTEETRAGYLNSSPTSINFVLESGEDEENNNFFNFRIGECGWTPGKWAGGSLNASSKTKWVSVWDGMPFNDTKQEIQLSQQAQAAGDVLLADPARARQMVQKISSGTDTQQGYQGKSDNPSMPDLAIGIQGNLADWNKDGKYDQLWYSGEDARTIINKGGVSGDKYGDMSRKTVAYLLNVLGQPDYVAAPQMQTAIYNWLFYNGYNAKDNFNVAGKKLNEVSGTDGKGILSYLGNPDSNAGDADTDFVINFKTKQGSINNLGIGTAGGFGWDGTFSMSSSSSAWKGFATSDTNGDTVIDYRDYATVKTGSGQTDQDTKIYSGQWIFEVLSAQFDDSCNLALALDGTTAYATNGAMGAAYEKTSLDNLMNWDPSSQLYS